MITKEEFKQLKEYTPLTETVNKLKEVTAKHNVTCTTDLNQIKGEFKANLFTQLLTVDKGLKARYGLMRTDKAKADLLNQEILSLEGYDELDEIQEAITQYQNAFIECNLNSNWNYLQERFSPKDFIEVYEGNLDKALEGHVIDIEESEVYRQFAAIKDAILKLEELGYFNKYDYSNQRIFSKISKVITLPVYEYETGKPEIDIKRLNFSLISR